MAAIRELVWVEKGGFRGYGCSTCAWVFNSSGPPKGNSFDDVMRNFELLRDHEFALHVCAEHPKAQNAKI
ncbi:MAG TPA: hypothetical protein VNZ03_13880 [Terriglobales bacterium]|nr:hypothetical protein [Terriglobales bacterium]